MSLLATWATSNERTTHVGSKGGRLPDAGSIPAASTELKREAQQPKGCWASLVPDRLIALFLSTRRFWMGEWLCVAHSGPELDVDVATELPQRSPSLAECVRKDQKSVCDSEDCCRNQDKSAGRERSDFRWKTTREPFMLVSPMYAHY